MMNVKRQAKAESARKAGGYTYSSYSIHDNVPTWIAIPGIEPLTLTPKVRSIYIVRQRIARLPAPGTDTLSPP
jgi:hypothetical protein